MNLHSVRRSTHHEQAAIRSQFHAVVHRVEIQTQQIHDAIAPLLQLFGRQPLRDHRAQLRGPKCICTVGLGFEWK